MIALYGLSVFAGAIGVALTILLMYCGIRFLDDKKYAIGVALLFLGVAAFAGFLGVALEISHDAAAHHPAQAHPAQPHP